VCGKKTSVVLGGTNPNETTTMTVSSFQIKIGVAVLVIIAIVVAVVMLTVGGGTPSCADMGGSDSASEGVIGGCTISYPGKVWAAIQNVDGVASGRSDEAMSQCMSSVAPCHGIYEVNATSALEGLQPGVWYGFNQNMSDPRLVINPLVSSMRVITPPSSQ
jgi:hypothetical protein